MSQLADDFQRIALNYAFFVFYALYFVIAFGLNDNAPIYLTWLNNGFTLYFSIFLIYRFNPWRTIKFTEFDRTIAYYAGIQLLLSTVIVQSLIAYVKLKGKRIDDKLKSLGKKFKGV